MIEFSAWKIFGIFSTVLIVFLFFGGTAIELVKAGTSGDWKGMLINSGGKIFALDKVLVDETDYIVKESATPTNQSYDVIFHIAYAFTVLFMFFFIFMLLFKLGNWIFGMNAMNPLVDVLIVVLIIAGFFALEFLYTLLVLKETIYPLQGIWTFIKNLPAIAQNLI